MNIESSNPNENKKTIDLYDQQKYFESLKPRSDFEKNLWSQVEKADKPIRNILKRLNRISLDKFLSDEFITIDSCSGHVTENGDLIEGVHGDLNPHIMFEIKVDHSSVIEDGQEVDIIEDLNEDNTNKLVEFFRNIFIQSVNELNKKYNKSLIKLGYWDKRDGEQFVEKEFISPEPILSFNSETEEFHYHYNVSFDFSVEEINGADQVLKNFWSSLENKLKTFDGIEYKTNFGKDSFLRNNN